MPNLQEGMNVNEVTQNERPRFFKNAGTFLGVWMGVGLTIGIINQMYIESVGSGYANQAYLLYGCVTVMVLVSVLLYRMVMAKKAAFAGLLVGWWPLVSQVIAVIHAAP